MEVVLKVTLRPLRSFTMAQPSKAEIQSMTKEPIEVLDDLADQVADEFEAYRQPDEFKDVSLVIENSDEEHPTLIVHVDREDAESLADRIDEFLREHGARTERERHSATDVSREGGVASGVQTEVPHARHNRRAVRTEYRRRQNATARHACRGRH